MTANRRKCKRNKRLWDACGTQGGGGREHNYSTNILFYIHIFLLMKMIPTLLPTLSESVSAFHSRWGNVCNGSETARLRAHL